MRLLLSICLLLASVQAARAQGVTWPAPGSPMHGETLRDSRAATTPTSPAGRLEASGESAWLNTAFGGMGDDGKSRTAWATGAWAPFEDISGFGPGNGDVGYGGDLPRDDRRAIRVFRRVLLPPDVSIPALL